MAAGAVGAHVLAYLIVSPNEEHREQLLAETGHAWFEPTLLIALALALVLVGFVARVVAVRRPRGRGAAPAGLCAALPPATFVVQEHLERVLLDGAPAAAFVEPAFVVGLLLQLPFALAALVAARVLIACADVVADLLGGPAPLLAAAPHLPLLVPAATRVGRTSASGRRTRAPPLLLPAR
jgi:hypothetical protein